VQIQYHFSCILFISAGIVSYQRKFFMSKLTTALININDNDEDFFPEKNLMPTIVFMKWSNLKAWLKFKDTVINVGHKYNKRITLFTSMMFLLCIFYLVFILLVYFKLINFEIPYVLWTVAIIDIGTIMYIILWVIRYGAATNSLWDKDIGILIDIKWEMHEITLDFDTLKNK